MDVPRISPGTRSTPGTNPQANTSYQDAARTHRRRTPSSFRPSSNPNLLILPLLLSTLVPLTHAASSDPLTLNLPHVPTTCETLNLTWTGGTANYALRLTQPPSSVPLSSWTALRNTSLLWTANACGGTGLSLTLTDAGGYESVVSFSVVRGADGSCLSAAQRDTVGCVLSASASVSASTTKTKTAGAQGTAGTGTGANNNAGGAPRVGVVVGVVVGIGVLVMVLAICWFLRARRRRGAGVLGPGSRPYFVRHERDRARRRGTLLEMPPPVYSDSQSTGEERLQGHTPDSSPSPPVSVTDHEQTHPLMPLPETVQMAQLPRGRIEPEQLPTPFLSTYESSPTTVSREGHARESSVASHSSGAAPTPAPVVPSSSGEVHVRSAGFDDPPPPYTLTA